ncbi:hypothetical protein EV2_020395 [Malus domestica]
MGSSSAFLTNPLTSSFLSGLSELTAPIQFRPACPTTTTGLRSIGITKINGLRLKGKCWSSSVVCKVVCVKPQTTVEGLNIAEDITQVAQLRYLQKTSEDTSSCRSVVMD